MGAPDRIACAKPCGRRGKMIERLEEAHLWAWSRGSTRGCKREGRREKTAGNPGRAMWATPSVGVYPKSNGRALDAGTVGWHEQTRQTRGS